MRRPSRLLLLTAVAAVVATALVIVSGPWASVSAQTSTPTVTFLHAGHLPAQRAGSFISLLPACGCANRTALEQFSLKTGRPLGAIASVSGPNMSDPHASPDGSVLLTFSNGSLCKAPVGGGISAGPCDPLPNSCTSDVERLNPRTGVAGPLLTQPSSTIVTDAVPSPQGGLIAMTVGACLPESSHLVIRDLNSGREWAIGADLPRCTNLGAASWSLDGSRLVFPYGPLVHMRDPGPASGAFCTATRFASLVVVSARTASRSSSWKLIAADPGCSFQAAAFDRSGIAAVEGCKRGDPPGYSANPNLGDAYLVQLDRLQIVRRFALKRGYNDGAVAQDPRTGNLLVSEYQAANQGFPVYDWVWSYNGRALRLVRRYHENDAPQVIAEPW